MATSLFNRSVQWEWEGDKGVWQQYPLDIQQEVSQAFEKGNKEVIDFSKLIEIHLIGIILR